MEELVSLVEEVEEGGKKIHPAPGYIIYIVWGGGVIENIRLTPREIRMAPAQGWHSVCALSQVAR